MGDWTVAAMTEEELKRIEDEGCGCVIASGYGCAAEALVAEVRRLRGLIKQIESAARQGAACPYCDSWIAERHAADCPAFNPDGTVK